MSVNNEDVQIVAEAIAAVYENKQVNKKNDISGDFSTDNESYPTVKALKILLANSYLTSTEINTLLSSYVTGTALNTLLAEKSDSDHTHGNLSNDGKIGSASGKIITTGTGGLLQASDSITKDKISDFPSSMTPTSHAHGDITNDGKLGSTANKPVITTTGGKITVGSFGTEANTFCQGNDSRLSDARAPTAHNQDSSTVTESAALTNLGTAANATQAAINSAVNSVIGTLQSIKAVQVVTTLGTASADTMNKLYIISEDGKVNVYYTEQSGSNYTWHKMDADILDELSISWSDVSDKPSTFTPASHTHGNITNDGKVGTSSGKPLITTTGGVVATGSFGTTSGTFAEGNHTHLGYASISDVDSEISAFATALAEAINPST